MHPDEQPQPLKRDEGVTPARAVTDASAAPPAPDGRWRHLRRVRIEEDQERKIEHARVRAGYADDIPLGAHDDQTFRLINQRKQLDELAGAELVVPELDRWKFLDEDGRLGLAQPDARAAAEQGQASRGDQRGDPAAGGDLRAGVEGR